MQHPVAHREMEGVSINTDRFLCASSGLRSAELLRQGRKVLLPSLGLAIVVHLSLTQLTGLGKEENSTKPLTTQFIKRQPRLSKPLELRKRPQPKRRRIQRKMVSVKAKMQRDQRGAHFQPMQVLRGLVKPSVEIGRATGFGSFDVEPRSMAEVIEGTKEVEQKIDMTLELLDMECLDTGRYHAMVVQDPDDKRNLQGFCRLSWLYIPRLHDKVVPHTGTTGDQWANYYIGRPVRHLVNAMNEYTAIKTSVGERVIIGSPETFQIPWIFHLYFAQGYTLSDTELGTIGSYLMRGGFIFADANAHIKMSVASSHIKNLIAALETQGVRAQFEILPNSHAIYHCYFDFDGPPPSSDAGAAMYPGECELTPYLEGLEVEGRLVAILSRKAYYGPWYGGWADATRQFQFGVNLIIFALTQEGSITHRLMDSVK